MEDKIDEFLGRFSRAQLDDFVFAMNNDLSQLVLGREAVAVVPVSSQKEPVPVRLDDCRRSMDFGQ